MADLSKITLPSGTTYNIKDSTARSDLNNKAPINSPALTGVPTAPTASDGTNDGQIATTEFVNSAIARAIAGGSSFQGVINSNTEIEDLDTYTKSMYWVVGTPGTYVGQTCENGDFIFCIQDMGSSGYQTSDFSVVQANIDLSIFGDLAFKDTASGSFTPEGSVSLSTSNINAVVGPAQSGEATYTPSGSVSAPTISVSSAGSTTSVSKNISVSAPGSTAPSNPVTYYSVSDETLSLYQIGYDTETVKTGDASYEATAPTFTGTGTRLITDNISVASSATFTGTSGTVTVS